METKGLGHVPGARIRRIAEPGETKQVPGPFKWSVSIPLPSFLLLTTWFQTSFTLIMDGEIVGFALFGQAGQRA